MFLQGDVEMSVVGGIDGYCCGIIHHMVDRIALPRLYALGLTFTYCSLHGQREITGAMYV
jgi:hypothetical protein